MDKTLQTAAWRCLPREFREEVKKIYNADDPLAFPEENGLFDYIFGRHNLTSDAEGEEMLMCNKGVVKALYLESLKCAPKLERWKGIKWTLDRLFGSKCLPDEPASEEPKPFKYKVGQKVILHFYGGEVSTITEAFNDGGVWNKYKVKALPNHVCNENELDPYEEPKPAEPRYHVGQRVQCLNDGKTYIVLAKVGKHHYSLQGVEHDVHEDYLEPYNETAENKANEIADKAIKPIEEHFDNILKDSFAKERRLNIATTIIERIIKSEYYSLSEKYREDNIKEMVKVSLQITDAIMAECEKGGVK